MQWVPWGNAEGLRQSGGGGSHLWSSTQDKTTSTKSIEAASSLNMLWDGDSHIQTYQKQIGKTPKRLVQIELSRES